jgi:hypothetical protein
MKHLKTYKIFESLQTDIEVIKDILLPIGDMGYEIRVKHYIIIIRDLSQTNTVSLGECDQIIIRVVSWGDDPLFISDDVRDDFIRMKEYLESEGYESIKANFYLDDHRRNEKDINDFIDIHRKGDISHKELIVNLLFDVRKKYNNETFKNIY